MRYGRKRNQISKSNAGTTLIEMVVAFALLGIFLVAASSIITNVTGMYYRVKAETYSKQVSDIVLEKVVSEIEGAVWVNNSGENLKLIDSEHIDDARESIEKADGVEEAEKNGAGVVLFDKTDTKIMMFAEDDELIVHYYEIHRGAERYNATDWKFSDSVYNGFAVKELQFVRGNKLGAFLGSNITVNGETTTPGDLYGLSPAGQYSENVIVVFLHLKSERYGDYYTYRFVRMYNVN